MELLFWEKEDMLLKKLRLSYSLLNLFRMGKYDECIVSYLHLGHITNEAIEEGRKWDKYVQDSVNNSRIIPEEFGGGKLNSPETQKEITVSYNDMWDLKGVLDIYDSPIIYEIKTGLAKDSGDYSMDFQIPIYFLLCELAKLEAQKAIILHYNQKDKELDKTLIYKSQKDINKARNFVDTLAPEIYEFFDSKGILDKSDK